MNVTLPCLCLHTATPSTDPSRTHSYSKYRPQFLLSRTHSYTKYRPQFCSPEGREAMPHENCIFIPKRFQNPKLFQITTQFSLRYTFKCPICTTRGKHSTTLLFVTSGVPTATRHSRDACCH